MDMGADVTTSRPELRTRAVVVIVPAHDEEAQIVDTIRSLRAQTRPPDRIVVAADNCTDATVVLARAEGVEVHETVGNTHKKAGAINQVLEPLLADPDSPVEPGGVVPLAPDDAVLIMDADTVMAPRFLDIALAHLDGVSVVRRRDRRDARPIGGVGGLFVAKPDDTPSLVKTFQMNEYSRYSTEVVAKGGQAAVLTGTGTLFSAQALRDVLAARRTGRLPGGSSVYDVWSLTEDNEMTLAVKHLGYRCISPAGCVVETDIMTTWRDLWIQRLRWQRGALDNLRHYGLTRVTRRYVGKQLAMYLGGVFSLLYVLLVAASFALYHGVEVSPFWASLTLVFVAEKLVTLQPGSSWRQRLVAGSLLPELLYDAFQWAVFLRAGALSLRRTDQAW